MPNSLLPDAPFRSAAWRLVQLGGGVTLILLSPVIAIPTPPPVGILTFAFGLALVLRNSRWARRRYVRYTRRHPRLQKAVNFGLRRRSKRRLPAPVAEAIEP